MINNDINKPMLTEPGVKYFINETLRQCHKVKEKYQNTFLNIFLLILFFVVLGGWLLYNYKGKLSQEEIEEKEMVKKQYILSKIKNYQSAKIRAQQELITGLPHWENEFDIIKDTPINKIRDNM